MIRVRVRPLLQASAMGLGLGTFSLLADGVVDLRALDILGNLASPWAVTAFAAGWLAPSRWWGASAGATSLLVAVAMYYSVGAVIGNAPGAVAIVFLVAAIVLGPVMGFSGAAVASDRGRPPTAAIAAPSIALVAEAVYFIVDRRIWLWNLSREPYRLTDLGVLLALISGALVLPLLMGVDRNRRRLTFASILIGGLLGAGALFFLYRLIAEIS